MLSINPRRKKFCRLLTDGETGAGAYRKAYKNKNSTTCKTNAYRLMQQANVLVYLTIIQKAQPAAQQQAPAASIPRAKPKPKTAQPTKANAAGPAPSQTIYPTVSSKQEGEILSSLMRGEARMRKYKWVKGKWELVAIPTKPRQIIKCIRQLNKMDGAYAPRKRKRKKRPILLIINMLQ